MSTERRGIPRKPIFWTLDQVAAMLGLEEGELIRAYVWHDGEEFGAYRKNFMRAVNIASGRKTAFGNHERRKVWRVSEQEFERWLTYHSLWVYDTGPTPVPQVPRRTTSTPNEHPGTMVDIVLDRRTPE